MIQSNQKHHSRSHPTIRLLGSPTHLIFQLIRFTTLPYMICQIINNKKNQNLSKTELTPLNTDQNSSLAPVISKQTQLASQFNTSIESTKLFHQFIRNFNAHHQLINLVDQFINLIQPPKLHPKTVQHIFAIIRPTILDRLHQHQQNLVIQPRISTSTAWESEAMNQIAQSWSNQSARISSVQQTLDHSDHLSKTISALQEIQSHQRAFLSHGPPRCDCQRKPLPPKNLSLDQVGSLNQSTLAQFAQKLEKSINLLTYLRIIDLTRQAHRWDLAVIFLDRTRAEIRSDHQKSRLSSRRLGQVTGLLEFLRGNGRLEPETNPLKMWSVHFVCESIERSCNGHQDEWVRINRLSLDVLTQYASTPIGFDRRRLKTHQKSKSLKQQMEQWPCFDYERHKFLLDTIACSANELEFAVLTRQRCVRLLSRLTRHICQPALQNQSSNIHSWSAKSAVQLRLLEYLAQQGTQQQFMSLLQVHLDRHRTNPKLARLILLGARRFACLSENSELITQALTKLDHRLSRPIVDFLLRPRQPLANLKNNLDICLASLPVEKDARMSMYSHLIYRLSQLPTPLLALQVWETINQEERSQRLLKVGRRTRQRLRRLIQLHGEDAIKPVEKLPNQLLRSMVYVYKNLTHWSPSNIRNEFAVGKHYESLYQRLSFKSTSYRLWKRPLTKRLARSHLIFNLIQSKLDRVDDYKILKSLENALLSSPGNDHTNHNCFENLVRFLLVNKVNGSESNLVKRYDQLQQHEPSLEVKPKPGTGRRRNSRHQRHCGRLGYFKYLRDWIRSRGGFTATIDGDHPDGFLSSRRSDKVVRTHQSDRHTGLPHQHAPPLRALDARSPRPPPSRQHPPRRRRTCSRYWARIVADHSLAPSVCSPETHQTIARNE